MPDDTPTITPRIHRELATSLFNATWDLLDKADRTPNEDDTMIHTAHASAYHWRQIGEPLHFARSDWQISRVYAVLNRPEAALYHAQHSLETCQAADIVDFDLAFAYEALARAYAIGGQPAQAAHMLAQAREAGAQIAEQDDRDYFFSELATVPGSTDAS